MGLGYIPYSEISFWLDEMRIWIWEERVRYRHFITFIDGIFVSKESERSEKKSKAKSKSNPAPPPRRRR
jgi:hypothetical protein